jgi:hypothetical protein
MGLFTGEEEARADLDGALPAWMTPLFVHSGASERPPAACAAAPPAAPAPPAAAAAAAPAPPAEVAAVPMVAHLYSRACDRYICSNRASLKATILEAGGAGGATKGAALERAVRKLGVTSFRDLAPAEQLRYKTDALQGPKRRRGPLGHFTREVGECVGADECPVIDSAAASSGGGPLLGWRQRAASRRIGLQVVEKLASSKGAAMENVVRGIIAESKLSKMKAAGIIGRKRRIRIVAHNINLVLFSKKC